MQLLAVHPNPTLLADFQALGRGADRRDPAHDFVSQHGGILRHSPVVVQHREIGMAQAAMFHRDFHVLGPKRSEINRLLDQLSVSPLWRPTLERSSVFSELPPAGRRRTP